MSSLWALVSSSITPDSLVWVALTVVIYLLSLFIFRQLGENPVWHPILLGALLLSGICYWLDVPAAEYQKNVSLLTWLLGPATVALAVPLYKQVRTIFSAGWKGFMVILVGGSVAPLTSYLLLLWLDFSEPLKLTILTKSITTPLAMDAANSIGGLPEIAAAIVIFTGIFGVTMSAVIFKLSKCTDEAAQGITLGTIAHAVGTSRAAQLGERTAAFSTMALCLNGILTALILPLLIGLFG